MPESIKPIIKRVVSQNIPDENIDRQRMTDFYNALKNTINDIGNNWNGNPTL